MKNMYKHVCKTNRSSALCRSTTLVMGHPVHTVKVPTRVCKGQKLCKSCKSSWIYDSSIINKMYIVTQHQGPVKSFKYMFTPSPPYRFQMNRPCCRVTVLQVQLSKLIPSTLLPRHWSNPDRKEEHGNKRTFTVLPIQTTHDVSGKTLKVSCKLLDTFFLLLLMLSIVYTVSHGMFSSLQHVPNKCQTKVTGIWALLAVLKENTIWYRHDCI